MKNKTIKLLAVMPLLALHSFSFSSLYAMDFDMYNEDVVQLPLVGRVTMDYLKATSHEVHKPVTLFVSVSQVLGGRSADDRIELDEGKIPELIDLPYVRQIIDSTRALSVFLEELRNANIDQAKVKVCLYFDGVPSHREKINGHELLDLRK